MFTILGSELELNVTVLRPRIAHKIVLNVLESQENRLLILGKLRIAIGSACRDSSANSSSVKKGPINIQCRQVHSADSVKRRIPVKFVESKKPREVDPREKVSGGNPDSFCRGMQALLRRAYVGATAYKIGRCSWIDTIRKMGEWPCDFELRDESIWRKPAQDSKAMFIERDRREQLWNTRGRCLEKSACSRRIELCPSTGGVSRINQSYRFLLVFNIPPRYPEKFLPSTEIYIGARDFSNYGNLYRSKATCISKSKLALRLYVVTNATKEIEFPTCIDLWSEKAIISRIAERLVRAEFLPTHARARRYCGIAVELRFTQ